MESETKAKTCSINAKSHPNRTVGALDIALVALWVAVEICDAVLVAGFMLDYDSWTLVARRFRATIWVVSTALMVVAISFPIVRDFVGEPISPDKWYEPELAWSLAAVGPGAKFLIGILFSIPGWSEYASLSWFLLPEAAISAIVASRIVKRLYDPAVYSATRVLLDKKEDESQTKKSEKTSAEQKSLSGYQKMEQQVNEACNRKEKER